MTEKKKSDLKLSKEIIVSWKYIQMTIKTKENIIIYQRKLSYITT